MSTIIKVRCTDQVLTFENTPVIASGGLEEDFVSFAFCSKWDGLVKTAVFWRSEEEVYHVLLDEADSCPIPREVLAVEGVIYFGVFGVSETGKQRTSEVLRYNIAKGAITEGTKPTDPTPDIYTQILAEFLRYENEIDAKLDDFAQSWAEYQATMTQARTDHEEAVAQWQEDLETAVSETQESYESRMNQEWENFKTGGDFVLKTDYQADQEEQAQAMTTLEDKVDEVEQTANAALAGLDSVANLKDEINRSTVPRILTEWGVSSAAVSIGVQVGGAAGTSYALKATKAFSVSGTGGYCHRVKLSVDWEGLGNSNIPLIYFVLVAEDGTEYTSEAFNPFKINSDEKKNVEIIIPINQGTQNVLKFTLRMYGNNNYSSSYSGGVRIVSVTAITDVVGCVV